MATQLAELSSQGALVPSPFRVVSRVQDTADTWTLELVPGSGAAPAISPGQFMMVYAFGVGEVPISVSRTDELRLTVRDVGTVTHAICATGEGGYLGLRGPYGNAWPVEAAAGGDVVVVAGGIGLAPLRPVVHHALAHRDAYGAVTILYGARTPGDLLYLDELDSWCVDAHVDVTVDAPSGSWAGMVGVVPKLVAGAPFRPDKASAFVCGPEIMMDYAIAALLERGLSSERIFISLERHMDCGVGLCGHCQLGPTLICRDGPVYTHAVAARWLEAREL